ncbi:Flp pilus assembly protein TadD, contains TPR repeats [Meinhardsimonia xiamenensis]|uniref:Flp pilus assembly protein TadD, contains TPR repeats n=1 Tax=Meinhardsimonia xiamenensis TaxID=990712 RepID=A0A1G8YHV4_9RHOB|nr:tetratricopeptide repeat protein [Meinhardsimonia xiamenensis]PRX37298.1 Flp pilus assembly protein TadD [Meinhardsimonia xiamenensis]SDK01984.1 Flp pilus assembly protein TadD, contains TPR repeats [Meinhardsimonia xiamenensis]
MTARPFTLRLAAAAVALLVGLPATAQGLAGPYLAGQVAAQNNDFEAATTYFSQALIVDSSNPVIMENALRAYVGLGRIEQAVAIARRMQGLGQVSQVAAMVLFADHMKKGNYPALLDDLTAGVSVGPMVDGLLKAWAQFGAGRMSEALESFDEVAATRGVEMFGLYHKALALAAVGDMEGAEEILSGRAAGPIQLDRRGVIAYAQILSQLERNADAVELIDKSFAGRLDEELAAIKAALEAGETLPFTAVPDAAAGAAEVFFAVAGALDGEANDAYALMYSRMAEYLRPDHVGAILLSAGLLERMGRHELATETYLRIPPDSPAYVPATIGRAEALHASGKVEEAIATLRALAEEHPDNPSVHVSLGDMLRREERYAEAAEGYSRAIALYDEPERGQWVVYFGRGICYERTGEWEKAEADFRKALELEPDQPQVLNYLGYSYVEMNINLDEAMDLIKRAVEARPDSGYIVDSLGWVQFRLGDYEQAVVNLERAAELMPTDPIINDHLGDAYWAVGREREARVQWKRALSFNPEPDEADRIRRKLEVGLDAVLIEEGAQPIRASAREDVQGN